MKRCVALLTFLLVLGFSQSALAITALSTGYYQNNNAGISYTGTWSTGVSNSTSYGDSLAQSNDVAGKATVYTQPTVGRIGIYYSTCALCQSFAIALNGTIIQTIATYSASTTYNNYYEFGLTAGTNKIEIYPLLGGYLVYQGWQLLPATTSALAVTVVVSFPTHTPTPTYTPTITPSPTPTNTPGPSPTPTLSPTPTATITATANYVLRSTVVYGEDQHQDVAVVYQISAGDIVIGIALLVLIGLFIFEMIRREWRE